MPLPGSSWILGNRLIAIVAVFIVVVADGTDLAAEKVERVLTNDPGMGVVRHVDAGYDRADEVARERGVRVPTAFRSRES